MLDFSKLKDVIPVLLQLLKTKGGTFILGALITGTASAYVFLSTKESHERELTRYAKTEEDLNKKLDSCQAKSERMYLKGIEENINKDLLAAKLYKQVIDDVKDDMSKEEKLVLQRIKQKERSIEKEIHEEI